ncbi:hypothetical protein [Demetria terragena]|uniref:hypothetical protein n=1 Tax=Demetria terragena TaxID=63959 RepID=UPI000688D775|nr:hypothetical protein [Demetria terragena]
MMVEARYRLQAQRDRGDVPGWVLITLMTAGIVTLLWSVAGDLLKNLFTNAVNGVSGPGS